MFDEHPGFSRKINQQTHYFFLSVLSFGLSTAPFVFTKVVQPLMKYWQMYAIRIACVLDDGLGIKFRYSKFETSSKFVLNTLVNDRFVTSKEESVWEPTKILTWLEVCVHSNKGCIYVSKERISNLLETVDFISNNPYISA